MSYLIFLNFKLIKKFCFSNFIFGFEIFSDNFAFFCNIGKDIFGYLGFISLFKVVLHH